MKQVVELQDIFKIKVVSLYYYQIDVTCCYLWLRVSPTHVCVETAELAEDTTTFFTLERWRVAGPWVCVNSLHGKRILSADCIFRS